MIDNLPRNLGAFVFRRHSMAEFLPLSFLSSFQQKGLTAPSEYYSRTCRSLKFNADQFSFPCCIPLLYICILFMLCSPKMKHLNLFVTWILFPTNVIEGIQFLTQEKKMHVYINHFCHWGSPLSWVHPI